MKITFNKYFYLITILLLNTFATIQANEFNKSLEISAFENCIKELHNSAVCSNDDISINCLSGLLKYSEGYLFCEVVEGDETEDSELSSKSISYSNKNKISFFSIAELFESSSKALQRNNYRPQSDINEPSLRLHLQFQVFVI